MKLIIAGGGTAGHINPGIAVAKHIQSKYSEADVLFIGTEKGLEKELVPREGFKIEFIKAKGFKRKFSLDIFLTVKEMISGYLKAKKIIRAFKPDIVIGTGGYVCFPVVLAAHHSKVPALIHESNSIPGIANRILGKFADSVAISFKDTENYFKGCKKVIFTGNPVREEIIAVSKGNARRERHEENTAVVLVFGGSSGAKRINEAIIELICINRGILPYNIILSTGRSQFDFVINELQKNGFDIQNLKNIKIIPYIFDMAEAMAGADLIVSRAGAVTISEITAIGLPAILIPFPYATGNHQEFNARALEKQGAAIVILENNLSGEILSHQIIELINSKEQLNRMYRNSKKMGMTDSVGKIGNIIEEITKK